MRITADANVLVRALVQDHPAQTNAAKAALAEADRIAIPIPVLCEIVWVLRRVYRKKPFEIAAALRVLLSDAKVDFDTDAVGAGMAMLDAGGGFADGIIAFEGRRLGGETFVTFDREAARLVADSGGKSQLLRTL